MVEGCMFVRSHVRPKGRCRIRQSIRDPVENLLKFGILAIQTRGLIEMWPYCGLE